MVFRLENHVTSQVTCIGGSQRCGTGEGMKLCPSSAVISVGTTCIDLPLSDGWVVESQKNADDLGWDDDSGFLMVSSTTGIATDDGMML